MSVWFEAHHEDGDFREYTSTSTDGGDLSVTAGAALAGTSYGLSYLVDDTVSLTASRYPTTSYTGIIRGRIYFNPNGLSMASGSNIFLHYVSSSVWQQPYSILCQMVSGNYSIKVNTTRDVGGEAGTGLYAITNEEHYIEVETRRASSVSASDGTCKLWIDNVLKETLTGLDNYDNFCDAYYVCAGYGYNSGTISGTFYTDELIINNDGSEIGPVGGGGITIGLRTA